MNNNGLNDSNLHDQNPEENSVDITPEILEGELIDDKYKSEEDKLDVNIKLTDNIFDIILKHAANEYIDLEMEKMESELSDIPDHVFSKNFDNNMKDFIRQQSKNIIPKKHVLLKRLVASLLIISIPISTLLAMNVDAFRLDLINIAVSARDTYNKIFLSKVDTNYDISKIPSDWEYIYVPEYLPSDYKLSEIKSSPKLCEISFTYNDKEILFDQYNNVDTNLAADKENFGWKKISIGRFKGYIVSKDLKTNLTWTNNDYTFKLSGNIDKEELINMAESIYTLKK